MKRIILIAGWFVVSVLTIHILAAGEAHAKWFDPAWSHRKIVTVSNPGGSQLSNFQVLGTPPSSA